MDTTTLSSLRALAARLASLLLAPAAPPPWRTLAPCTALRLPAGRGLRIEVEAGQLWLTDPDDPGDHVVTAGQSRPLRGGGQAVVECLGPTAARFRLLPAARMRGQAAATATVPERGTTHRRTGLPGAAMR